MMNNRPSPKLRRRLRKASDKMHEKEKAFMRSYNYETLVVLVFAVLFALSLRMFVFQITRVEGPSMEPTFFTDEQVYVDKVEFWFRPPQRGQVIICRYSDDGEAVIKRSSACRARWWRSQGAPSISTGRSWTSPVTGTT